MSKLTTIGAAARSVAPGSSLTFSGFGHAGHPLAFVRELIRQGTADLTLHAIAECWPAEFLVATGRVSRINLSNLMFEGLGRCRAISRAVEEGEVAVDDHSHLALSLRLLAGAWGVPFLPVRSMAGTDLAAVQTGVAPKYARVRSPFSDDEVGTVAALRPDVAVVHVNKADEQGNGIVYGAMSVVDAQVRSARKVIVTTERVVSADEITAENQVVTVPGIFVDAVVHTPYGAHPGGMYDEYDEDLAAMSTYYEASRSRAGLAGYFAEHVFAHADHAAYLSSLGSRRLFDLRADPALKIARGQK
ncbi:CoA transferase subunit A [Asanoa iriomotensis]|uniref:CoA-transferase n=1 Tax=Asanoa iriomotensis TaxID=234613 RepID=A0ABQ4BYX4_9ACTN|nr:CoA transferase subunit A [Asanoa iriomotensis]GIF55731.1 CoA-transferase [Asanoa iriomotensis]